MATKCPRCGKIFSDEEYKNHSCSGSKTVGGEEDLRKAKFEETADDTGIRPN